MKYCEMTKFCPNQEEDKVKITDYFYYKNYIIFVLFLQQQIIIKCLNCFAVIILMEKHRLFDFYSHFLHLNISWVLSSQECCYFFIWCLLNYENYSTFNAIHDRQFLQSNFRDDSQNPQNPWPLDHWKVSNRNCCS